MKIDLHHFNHPNKETVEHLRWIERALGTINGNLEKLMSSLDDVKASQAVTDTKIAAVKADVEALLAKVAAIPPAGLTPDQQAAIDAIAAHADAINASLSGVDAEVNPAPAAAPAAPTV